MGESSEEMAAEDLEITRASLGGAKLGKQPVDLATALLSLYQCMTDPEHYFEMVQVLTSWFQDDHDPQEFQTLEEHSTTLWETVRMAARASGGARAGRTPDLVVQTTPQASGRTALPAEILDRLCAEDITRISQWLETQGEYELVVRDYAPEGPVQLALIERIGSNNFGLFRTGQSFDGLISQLFETEFGMTPREMDVIRSLSVGNTLAETAELLGKSVETIRSQIKSVTGKLGVRSQTDIVRLALDARNLHLSRPANEVSPSKSGARILDLPDGRRIEYEVDPPADGRTVIFFHCVTFGRHWSDEAKSAAKAAGLRMIRVSRAGFGASTLNEKTGSDLLRDHVADYAAILAHEKIGSCTLMAQGLGMAAAYQFALAYPERVNGIVGLDVPPPVLKASDASLLQGTFKTGALGNLLAPASTKLIASFATRYLQKRRGPESKAPLALRGIDLTQHESASGLAAYQANYEDAQSSSGQCYWREASYSTVDWADAPTNANHRPHVRLLQSQDSVLVSPGATDAFVERIDARLRYIDSFLPLIAGPMSDIVEEVRSLSNRL